MADKKAFALKPKKSPFQLHKEAEEAKKKRLDEEAAQVYEEFVAAFNGESAQPGTKAFVRGGVVEPGSRPSSEPTATGDKKLGTRYVPSFIPPSLAPSRREEKPASVFDLPARADKSKPRVIDSMLEELQREQHLRRERASSGFDVPPEEPRGSYDTGDPTTTNLYVGNLAPTLDEHQLKLAFGKFGPIASVKVMWPRDEELRSRSRLTGFVAFMTRRSAEEALEHMNGRVLHDSELRLGWSKAVPLPAVPCWPPLTGAEPGLSLAPVANANAPHPPPPADAHARCVEVRVPRSAARLHVIDTLASYVALDGCDFERTLLNRERGNPEYAFVTDTASEEHIFYKWRVYALAQGDSLTQWREDAFQMVQGGAVWKPPSIQDVLRVAPASDAAGAAAAVDRPLSDAERDTFEDLLRGLTVERASIRTAMLFALDNADAAAEVSDTLVQALSLQETPAATKVARLFLLSDILHNSNAQVHGAASYRTLLSARLPEVFERLHEAFAALDSRITAQAFRRHVVAVLRAWADWFMLGETFLAGLEATFLRSASGARLPDDATLRAQLEALPQDDLERRCRDYGQISSGGRASCIERLLAVDCYRRAQRGEVAPVPHAAPAQLASVQARADGGGWTTVSEPQQEPLSRAAAAAPERHKRRSRSRSRSRSPRRHRRD